MPVGDVCTFFRHPFVAKLRRRNLVAPRPIGRKEPMRPTARARKPTICIISFPVRGCCGACGSIFTCADGNSLALRHCSGRVLPPMPYAFSGQSVFKHAGLMGTPHCHVSPMQLRLHIDMKPSFDHQEYLETAEGTVGRPRNPTTATSSENMSS